MDKTVCVAASLARRDGTAVTVDFGFEVVIGKEGLEVVWTPRIACRVLSARVIGTHETSNRLKNR